MKKIMAILLIVFIFPIMVKADMGAPVIQPYEAYIVNASGADYYEYYFEDDESGYKKVGTLDYDTKIKVEYESSIDGKNYAQFEKDENLYYILTKDIIPIKDEFVIEDNLGKGYVYKLDDPVKITVLKEDGIKMHKGPANAYSVVGTTIPKGTKLEYVYNVGEDGTVWVYVEYKNIKGWISTLEGTVGSYIEENMLISKDLEIKNEGKVVGTIPANTMLESYYTIDPWSWGYYITYDEVSGYVNSEDVSIAYGTWQITSKDNKVLYEYADLNSKVLEDNIPANTTLEYSYGLGHHWTEWVYTTYNGKTGWVYYSDENVSEEKVSDETIETTKKITTTKAPDKIGVEENKFTGEQIVLLSVIAAVIITLTALVTVVLVNKKNKKM